MLLFLLACKTDPAAECPYGDPPPSGAPDESTGVVVVGAGPAGLAAAWELEQAGTSYLLFEREDTVGGAAVWAGGNILFAGSPEQATAGVTDSPATLLAEWQEMTGGDPTAPWVQAWANNAVPDVHDWLAGMGLTFSLSEILPEGGSVPRIHRTDGEGQGIVDAIASELDSSRTHLGRELVGLVCDGGRVAGARWREGTTEGWTSADSVVMATGGFLRDLDRVREERPAWADVSLYQSSSPLADGAGLALIEAAGGATTHLGAVGLYAHGTPDYRQPGTDAELLLIDLSDTLWVDSSGARFLDESRVVSFEAGSTVAALSGGSAWILWDADVDLAIRDPLVEDGETTTEPTFADAVTAGGDAFSADTLIDLANAIGIAPEVLGETAADYAAGIEEGDAFGKDVERIDALDTPPYYAFRLIPAVAKAFGGVAVDTDGQVLDTDGDPIPGLYAAGELTGMAGGSLVGEEGAFTGSMSAVLYSGRVAGRAAAE